MQELEAVTRRKGLEKEMEELERDFERYMADQAPVYRELPPPVSFDQALTQERNAYLRKIQWLEEGPDDYDVIDDTITSTQEVRYNYDPYLIWGLSLVNAGASGGPSILVRFTYTPGRWKQYKLRGNAGIDLDLKGFGRKSEQGMGKEFSVVTDSGTAELDAMVLLKQPLSS